MSREPYDPQESCAQSLRSIDETLEAILETLQVKRDLAEIVPADQIIAIERARLAAIITEKFDNGNWDTTSSAVPGVSVRAVLGLLVKKT
jgi:hypothetical protein